MGDAIAAQGTAKGGYDAFIAEKFGEAHVQRVPFVAEADSERIGVTTARISAAIFFCERMAARVTVLHASHMSLLSHPSEVAAVIEEAAASVNAEVAA